MEKQRSWKRPWVYWAISSAVAAGYLATGLFVKDAGMNPWLAAARAAFLPGETTHGHYQIELACESCHSAPFGGRDSLQESCVKCHGAELKAANDTHPKSKFTDPRNADRLEKLEATVCVTCHTEHRPRLTSVMGVTLPPNLCFHCHSEIAKDRPSHEGMAFDTCNSAGCHKYHDNRALYGDFLVKHASEPALLAKRRIPERDFGKVTEELASYPLDKYPRRRLGAGDADAAPHLERTGEIMNDWLASRHAAGGVNCSGCHLVKRRGEEPAWIEKPDHTACTSCHSAEVKGFLSSRHGMRLDRGLAPMSPARARQPMKPDAHSKTLACTTCHAAHRYDTFRAQVDACLGCHDDQHSRSYVGSPHHDLWEQERSGRLPAGSGVTCASCHLPRVDHRDEDVKRTLVQHNQNDTLRPNEKMIRPVCMNCHGVPFAIDALADPALIANNFRGSPVKHIRSIDMALQAERRAEESRRLGNNAQ